VVAGTGHFIEKRVEGRADRRRHLAEVRVSDDKHARCL
jgi:hypothetical protein